MSIGRGLRRKEGGKYEEAIDGFVGNGIVEWLCWSNDSFKMQR
jgi:hypothetical protein